MISLKIFKDTNISLTIPFYVFYILNTLTFLSICHLARFQEIYFIPKAHQLNVPFENWLPEVSIIRHMGSDLCEVQWDDHFLWSTSVLQPVILLAPFDSCVYSRPVLSLPCHFLLLVPFLLSFFTWPDVKTSFPHPMWLRLTQWTNPLLFLKLSIIKWCDRDKIVKTVCYNVC